MLSVSHLSWSRSWSWSKNWGEQSSISSIILSSLSYLYHRQALIRFKYLNVSYWGIVRKGELTEGILSTAAVLNRFRLADHLTNFVSVRGPQKISYILLGKFLNFWWPFLVFFPKYFLGSQTTKRNFANFPNFLAFSRVKDRKNIKISIFNLVVTQTMKRYQRTKFAVSSETSLKGSRVNFLNFFYFPIVMTHLYTP